MNSKTLSALFVLAVALYSLFLSAPDPIIRGGALWALVLFGLVGSLLLSWRDLT